MKRVVTTIEKGTNYIFHLLASAGINFDNEYTTRYSRIVKNEHQKLLEEHKEALSFLNGSAGDLVEHMIFFPAYLNLDSQKKLAEYFGLLSASVVEGQEEHFLKRYSDYIERRNFWIPEINSGWFEKIRKSAKLIEQLGNVYIENFPTYESVVWPEQLKKLREKSAIINRELGGLNLIERWEKLTGIDFKVTEYQIVLVSAIEGGPNANSLGYDRNVFYSDTDLNWTIDFISHEVGTHIMADFGMPLMKKHLLDPGATDPGWAQRFYMAYECLAQFYNSIVLGREPNYDLKNFNSGEYLKFYRELYKSGIKSGEELLKAAIKTVVDCGL